ncbi:aminofutalosine synthase MqnE [Metallumcola ferriviriculae]|uniref:Aminodeoxyfutalosine synthase n=1 Tax=Metallumcola ferriviriculae TaxID=3039180 RepID=A0AAU0UN12_9FIRM|nr:aminofutalosine synthase MqnE [Desulfitibacteraceae bacterium MK1]
MDFLFKENSLHDLLVKVNAGQRLTRQDGIRLMQSNDLLTLGYMANMVREKINGDNAYFIVNRHINHTNICVNLCPLCAFGVEADKPNAYLMDMEEIRRKSLEVKDSGVTEIHLVGGLHPDMPYQYYLDMIKTVRKCLPDVHIQAFTAVEIDYLCQLSEKSVSEVFDDLKEVGLGSMPGGGAEIFAKRVREKICDKKISGERWLNVMKAAHDAGLKSNATMLYGHVETYEERIDHMIQLRELQDQTGGFQSFIPLAFHPAHTRLEQPIKSRTTGFEDLKVLAVSRLMLDNFDHIKAFWIMVGAKLAQISLSFGVDDIDGTVVEEKITQAAGGEAGQALTKKELVNMIKAAGRRPVERDTLYNVVRESF